MIKAIGLIFLAVTGSAVQGPPGTARIRWSVEGISESIKPGSRKVVTLTIRSTQELNGASLWISPSLRHILTIRPARLESLAANQNHELQLTFEVPATAPAEEHGGTVHVKLGEATVPVPLTVDIRVMPR